MGSSCRHPQKNHLVLWNGFFELTRNCSAYRNQIVAWLSRLPYFPFFPCLSTVFIYSSTGSYFIPRVGLYRLSWRAMSPPERCSEKAAGRCTNSGLLLQEHTLPFSRTYWLEWTMLLPAWSWLGSQRCGVWRSLFASACKDLRRSQMPRQGLPLYSLFTCHAGVLRCCNGTYNK